MQFNIKIVDERGRVWFSLGEKGEARAPTERAKRTRRATEGREEAKPKEGHKERKANPKQGDKERKANNSTAFIFSSYAPE